MQKLYNLQNYNGVMQVLSGLGNVALVRLKAIKEVVEGDGIQEMKKLEDVFAAEGNYKNYRELKKSMPHIPFIGTAVVIPTRLSHLIDAL